MSPAPANGRQLLTGIEAAGAYPVEYRFAHAQKGNRHLVVVFANFSAPGDYGWSNGVFDKLRANILWIRDSFEGNRSYYLCKEMDFGLERSVVTLISNVMKSLDLTTDSVTLWGGSKGGSAALHFGLKYGFRNIVAIAPQFSIGTYVKNVHPGVARFMLGDGVPEENVRIVDALVPDLVRSGVNRAANVYLVSSPQDDQYPTQVEPFLGLFQHYENFNFVFSDSPHIADHTQIAGRNVPMLMGIANLLIDGIAPRLGFVGNGFEEPDRDRSAIDSYLAATSMVRGEEFPPPTVTTPAPGTEVRRDAVRLTGHAPGAVRVIVWEHGKYLGQTDVDAHGTWSWELGRSWSKGEHPVKVYGVDASGFQSQRTEARFTAVEPGQGASADIPAAPLATMISTVGPSTSAPVVLEPVAHEQVLDPRVVFTGSAAASTQVGFRENGVLLGGTVVAPNGAWSWESGWQWAAGPHVIDVFSVDASGTESPVTTVPFTVMHTPSGATPAAYYGGTY
ncbi:hypothetical protein OG601_28470 [Streptomyces sp. NBC_01239]|uniref:hypothetical protein n=1 Tax=Streptomyces sp. NBC_01239 TaxID=2903792 RepID=UPI00224D2F3F|nr:hypothetical protein [Streptomyces sp. NBC_01239]MCX4814536.1 hypothetical protein [Streptomyces sp. NBC_01239]